MATCALSEISGRGTPAELLRAIGRFGVMEIRSSDLLRCLTVIGIAAEFRGRPTVPIYLNMVVALTVISISVGQAGFWQRTVASFEGSLRHDE